MTMMNWNAESMSSTVCDIASVQRSGDGIVLNFGVLRAEELTGALNAECLRRIEIDPEAAAALRLLLLRMLES
jgi:hypothetical protein